MRWVRALVALVTVAALVAGVPLALLELAGAPWPDSVPDLGAAWAAIEEGRVEVDVIVHVLSLVLWVAWVRLVGSVAVEVWHLVRRRPTPRVGVLGKSTQRLAAILVSGVAMLASASSRAPAAAAATMPEALIRLLDPRSIASEPLDSPVPSEPRPAPRPTWLVRQHDSWWGLAERLYGDGARWREVHELNLGRETAPGVRVASTTEFVEPGWSILLPEVPTVEVVPGDTLSAIAHARLGDPQAWPELWSANRGETFDGRQFDDPHLILPGWKLRLPVGEPEVAPRVEPPREPATALREVAPVSPAPEPRQRLQPVAVPEATWSGLPQPAAARADDTCPAVSISTGSRMPRGLGGAVLLATGAVAALEATRRRRWRSAPPHTRLPAPSPAAESTELAVRQVEWPELIVRLDLALRAAAAGLARQQLVGRAPRVQLAVGASTGSIELRFDVPCELGAPWRSAGDRWWQLPAGIHLEELAALGRSAAVPCPALVHVGRALQGEVFVDVEALGVLGIEGDPDDTQAIVRAIGLGLTLSPFSLSAALIGVRGEADTWQAERSWQLVDDPAEALELAVACTSGLAERLGGIGSTFLARGSGGLEAWEPAIVVLPRSDVAAEHVPLVRQLASTPGVGIALVTDVPGAAPSVCLRSVGGDWVLEPFGVEVVPVGLTQEEVLAVRTMLDEATTAQAAVEPPATELVPLPDWALMVRVLGPLDVVDAKGRRAQFERSKAAELVAWLALHRDRATRSAARTALWEIDVQDATFANVVSDARRSLARLVPPPPGEEWIGRTLSDQLPLHQAVVTDVDVLRAHLDRARLLDGAAGIDELRCGLSLVRDIAFSGTGFVWPDASGLTSEIVLLVVSAATEMASRCLEVGDIDGVFWATRQGLVMLPGHEGLVGLRMQAHAAAGDLAGVRSVWEEYVRSLAGDAWGETPSPKLVRLRQQLLSCTDRGSTPL